MKVIRSYTLDVDIIEKLKNQGVNASELINNLLKDYFTFQVDSPAMIRKIIADKHKEIEEAKNSIKSLNDKLRVAERDLIQKYKDVEFLVE